MREGVDLCFRSHHRKKEESEEKREFGSSWPLCQTKQPQADVQKSKDVNKINFAATFTIFEREYRACIGKTRHDGKGDGISLELMHLKIRSSLA